ncbi:protein UsfY [Mycolicibacterium hippocampi]|uniref:protein UsfY n=1 Tax=Mycolicibacterium hippocampi TaxID=659824 RepID=UPI003513477D
MPNLSRDPVDHARTTRQHAGESMKNGVNAPGLVAVGIALVALSAGLFALATGRATIGIVAVVIAVILGASGLGWLAYAHRRVRAVESRWQAEHPEEPSGPPTS